MKEKDKAEMENEKIRDMLDNHDSLRPADKNFLGRLILSRFLEKKICPNSLNFMLLVKSLI